MNAVAMANTQALPAIGAEQYLIFTLGSERYVVDIRGVREIINLCELTEIPLMPAAIRGVINLRGAVVPVLDLRARLGQGTTTPGRRTCVVILEPQQPGGQVIGVLVDAVNAVIELLPGDVAPPPSLGSPIRADFISGLAKLGERFAPILSLQQVLDVTELSELATSSEWALPAPATQEVT